MWQKLLYKTSPTLVKKYRKIEYELISKLIAKYDSSVTFLNYGYAGNGYTKSNFKLDKENEKDRYSIQMYHYVTSSTNIKDRTVLEVGSGRGGGAYYLVRKFSPKSYTGIDIAHNAIRFCKNKYPNGVLKFEQGDAENLTFSNESFDVVLNVETSHCYPNGNKFFSEVNRVLKKSGHFLIADLRPKNKVAKWKAQIENAGLKIINEEDISRNVFKSLIKDNRRKKNILNKLPKAIQKPFAGFAGVEGTGLYKDIKKGDYKYFMLVCTKV